MSLVNEMLSDLQKSESNVSAINGMFYTSPKKDKTPKIIIGSIITILAITAIYFVYQSQSIPKQENSNKVETISTLDVVNSVTPTRQPKPKASPIIDTYDFKSIETLNASIDLPTLPYIKNTTLETNSLAMPVGIKIKNINKIKTISRSSIAEKDLANWKESWPTSTINERELNLNSLLLNYEDLSAIWHESLIFLKSKKTNLFHSTLLRATTLFPKEETFNLMLAEKYFYSEKYETTLTTLKKIHKDTENLTYYKLKGLTLQKQNKHQQAISSFKRYLILSPNQGSIKMAIGISLERLNIPSTARSYFIAATKDDRLNSLQRKFIQQRLIALTENQ